MGTLRVEEASSLEYWFSKEDHVLPEVNGVKMGTPAQEGTYDEGMPPKLVTTTKLLWDDAALPSGELIWDGKQWQFNPDPVINQPPYENPAVGGM